MITITKEEIVSSSKASKNFGQILERLKSGQTEKIIISRNNKLEAVIIPIEEYEQVKEAFELVEHLEIFQLVSKRKSKKAVATLDNLISESGISRKDLRKEKIK
ncbi:MAG: type II toxin-antitoxin system Phd/YefM family antitoxin [Actinomycetia bacterium]|nr:type II toxin-antitoxin system Phd/YefM family antitoxin [Actinomycetes bacterium]